MMKLETDGKSKHELFVEINYVNTPDAEERLSRVISILLANGSNQKIDEGV